MKKNKKGFTLVELLAVIVILEVLILLATPAILNLTTNAQVSAFILEANVIAEQAEAAYTLNGGGSEYCVTLKELVDNGQLRKNLGDNYKGKVTITTDLEGSGNVTTMKIWLTNGSYWIDGEIREEIAKKQYEPLTTIPINFGTNVNCS